MYPEWTPPPAVLPAPPTPPRRRRGVVAAAGLVGAGVVAGAVIGATALSNAATSSTSPSASSSSSTSSTGEAAENHGSHGLNLSGTVTAVGSATVTIKSSGGTVQYAVSSTSDIDKNGESTLSKLVVGDAVTFSVDTVNSVQTIDKLHAGSEALDRPQGNSGTGG